MNAPDPRSGRTVLKDLFVRNLGLKLLALGLAIVMFSLVHGAEDVRRSVDVNILLVPPSESSGRMMISEIPPRVRITVHGSRSVINTIERESIAAVELDLREGRPPRYYFTEDDFEVPAGVSITQIAPAHIDLEWDERVEREIAVEVAETGGLPEGLALVNPPTPEPPVVQVVGAGAVVNGISLIRTEEVDLAGLREGTVERRLILDGLPEHARYAGDPHVSVRYEVARDLDVRTLRRLAVEAVGGGVRRVRPAHVTVTLRGLHELLADLDQEHIVPTADVSSLEAGPGAHSVDVTLHGVPDGAEVVSVQPASVLVTR